MVDNDTPDVPQKDSARVILEFCAEYDIPLRKKAIYGGLIRKGDITFSYRTVQEKVNDLYGEGYLERVEINSDRGEVLPLEDKDRRGYYIITAKGYEELAADN